MQNSEALIGSGYVLRAREQTAKCTFNFEPLPPMADQDPRQHIIYAIPFGSSHPNGINVAFCDGSVRVIPYTIPFETFKAMCVRNDGLVISE